MPRFASPAFNLNDASWYETLVKNGVGNDLQLCLDASDARSYDGSSQVWNDLSAVPYNWNRGADASATSTDPTFNGSAGGFSSGEYWSFDGGDYFTPVTGVTNAFFQSVHKPGALFTLAAWVRLGAVGPTNQYIAGNTASRSVRGFLWGFASTNGRLRFATANGSVLFVDATATSLSVPAAGQWYFFAIAVDAAASSGRHYMNGAEHSFSPNYGAASATDGPNTLSVGATMATLPLTNTSRMASFAAWSTALTKAELDMIFDRTRGKFGV